MILCITPKREERIVLKLIKRDFTFILGSKSAIFAFLFFVPLALFIMGDSKIYGMYAALNIIFVHIMTTASLSYDAKNNSHILFKSLPISNLEMVCSKYISLFINFILVVVYMFIVSVFMNYLNMINLDYYMLGKEITTYLLMSNIISLSIILPITFFSSPRIGDIIARIGMFITLNIRSYSLYVYNDFYKGFNTELITRFNSTRYLIGICLALIISIGLSTSIYNEKEFRG